MPRDTAWLDPLPPTEPSDRTVAITAWIAAAAVIWVLWHFVWGLL